MAWKYVQRDENGKYRTTDQGGGGGGGASALTDLDDVSVSSPTDGQILTYDDATDKWVNRNPSSGHTYSTTEQVVGKWVDGKPIYEKTLDIGDNIAIGYQASTTIPHNISNFKALIQLEIRCPALGLVSDQALWDVSNNKVIAYFRVNDTNIYASWGNGQYGGTANRNWYFTVQYTKTSD